MTDMRMPEKWLHDRRIQRLSDGHFRSFVNALMYSVSNRTDGVVEPEDLALIPGFAAGAVQAFVDARLWAPRAPSGWAIVDFKTTQTSRRDLEQLENIRRADRERKARKRAERAAATPDSEAGPGDVSADIPGDASGGQSTWTTQDRKGQDRTGQDKKAEPGELFVVDGRRDRSTFIENH